MSLYKLPRGLLEIPKGTNTSATENSNFSNHLERTNTLLAQFVSTSDSSNKLILRQELEESYFNLTMYYLKETVKHKIEQDMWNNLFKKNISDLQAKIKSKDKLESSKAQSEISIFLDEAVGFYSKCIDTISLVHNICLPGRSSNYDKSTIKQNMLAEEQASEEDIRYIVQHFYVHMGDLSRYHNLTRQAKFYYQLAVQLNPTSGHAYNQLAILESAAAAVVHANITASNYQHIIRTVLMYEYANSCEIPFPATRINLESLLRHVNEQSVSTLLTSNSSIGDLNCIHSVCIAWIHVYGNLRMGHSIQRCKQLQQRIIDWVSELVKNYSMCTNCWRDLVAMVALHCSLISSSVTQVDAIDNKVWSTNINLFSQDFINAICRGFVSLSHDNKLLDILLSQPGCVSIIIIFLSWINQYFNDDQDGKSKTKFDSSVSSKSADSSNSSFIPLKTPFGEEFVKLINILMGKKPNIDNTDHITLPTQLPELNFLTGFQPLKVPYKIYDIYSHDKSITSENIEINEMDVRISFIVSVCKRLAIKWPNLLMFDSINDRFSMVPAPDPIPVKKYIKIEPSIANRKPVNVALASMKNNNTKPNGFIGQNIPSKVSTDDSTTGEPTKGIITDVKIAKCIQEQIAQDIKSSSTPDNKSPTVKAKDDNYTIAPAPGLILSSNLPPDFKSISATTTSTQLPDHNLSYSSGTESVAQHHDQSDHNKINQANSKNHPYNPNREQFEKDLPPRFANKRSYSQEISTIGSIVEQPRNYFDQQQQNKGGFLSMNYWDSINDYPNNNSQNQFDTNLTKKESEILLPPTVPTSWLTDHSNQDNKMDSTSISNPQLQQFSFGNNLMHSQSGSHTFTGINNQSPQNHINMIQQYSNQFSQNTQPPLPTSSSGLNKDQETQLQYLLQSVTTNANAPRFRSQTDTLLPTQTNNFDNVRTQNADYLHRMDSNNFVQQMSSFINNSRMPSSKFPSIPPPTQQQIPSVGSTAAIGINSHLAMQQQRQQNFDATFQMTTMPNFYDKPVFSTSNQSTGFTGYSSGSIMSQQQQQQQQHTHHHHQVRHNNPLLNLLPPGFLNEAQR